MKVSAAGWTAGMAAVLLAMGCKDGKLIVGQQGGKQAPVAQQAQPQVRPPQIAPQRGPVSQPTAQAPEALTQAQGEQEVTGEVLTASASEVLVSNRGEPQIRLQIQPSTVVLVDGRQARAADIQEGSQVRASFHEQAGEPTATRLEVTTVSQPGPPPDSEVREPPFQAD